jgi:hypothetical protein
MGNASSIDPVRYPMLWHLYVRKRIAYVPTVARIGYGYLDIEPVAVASVADARALRSAIFDAMSRGNPDIPVPDLRTSKWVVLKYAKVKSPSQFEKGTSNWRIEERDGRYQVAPVPKHRDDRGWEDPRPENVQLLARMTAQWRQPVLQLLQG